MSEAKKKREAFETQNLAAARIILADPQRYTGLMLEWAHRIISKTNT